MDIDFFKSYERCLLEKGYMEADKLKDSIIPEILYKYFPCAENRINSLSNQELWLAQYETFNDPNEFKFMGIDKKHFSNAKLIGEKWDILKQFYNKSFFDVSYNDASIIMDKCKKIVSISCFTTNPCDDYFWTNYANNSNGFCVEYTINKKNIFYPVIYTNERIDVSDLLKTMIIEQKRCMLDDIEIERKCNKKINVISEDGMGSLSLLFFNYCCKGLRWKNEDEYRIVFANYEPQKTNGKAVSYSDLCINANKIFIGKNCSESDKKILENLAKKWGIKYIHM